MYSRSVSSFCVELSSCRVDGRRVRPPPKFRIKFNRKNSSNFWIKLHRTFQRTKSRFNLFAISSIQFNQIFPAGECRMPRIQCVS